MKNFLISFGLMLCLIGSACAVSVSAKSAILMEASTGKILFSKDIETERGMASTTKIMTALIVLESANLDEIVTVKQSCTGIEGSSMYLQAGEQLSVSDLLYGLLLKSGNDCAAVLADYIAGSTQDFVHLMNARARELGLLHTQFSNPSGLPDPAHFSTAHDMAKLTAFAMQNPNFRQIVSTQNIRIGNRFLTNHNRLLSVVEGCDGVKTGFTKSSGRCLVTSAERNGIRLIAVTLNAPNDWQDHQALYEFGFSVIKRKQFHKAGDLVTLLPIYGGISGQVSVVFGADLTAITTANESVETIYHLPRFLYAPISKGDLLGTASIRIDGEEVLSVPLIASQTISAPESKGLIHNFLYFIRKRFLG